MLLLNYAVCGSKKTRFIKEKEASDFLTGLWGVKSSSERIPVLGYII